MLARTNSTAYQVEKLADILPEIKMLAVEHYDEFASDRKARPLNPDYDLRLKVEGLGKFVCVTARRNCELIGYVWWWISSDLTSKDVLVAETDVYFVRNVPNRGIILLWLVRFSLRWLAARRVRLVKARSKVAADGSGRDAGPIWQALGFKPKDMVYSMPLEGSDA